MTCKIKPHLLRSIRHTFYSLILIFFFPSFNLLPVKTINIAIDIYIYRKYRPARVHTYNESVTHFNRLMQISAKIQFDLKKKENTDHATISFVHFFCGVNE